MRENRWLSTGLFSAGLLAGMAAHAVADDRQFLLTEQDIGVRSFFTLDFGQFGSTDGEVSDTRFLFRINRADKTAGFLKYTQNIGSLTLPGGFETGDIIVTIVPDSSAGEFDPDTGEFMTQEEYLIFFEGDLSEFGITSPIALPSTSRGTITFDSPRNGGVAQTWAGEGILQNPFNPNEPLVFTYTCRVESLHNQVDRGDLNCDGVINALDIEPFMQALYDPEGYDTTFEVCDLILGDFDQSGAVDALDIEGFLEALFAE